MTIFNSTRDWRIKQWLARTLPYQSQTWFARIGTLDEWFELYWHGEEFDSSVPELEPDALYIPDNSSLEIRFTCIWIDNDGNARNEQTFRQDVQKVNGSIDIATNDNSPTNNGPGSNLIRIAIIDTDGNVQGTGPDVSNGSGSTTGITGGDGLVPQVKAETGQTDFMFVSITMNFYHYMKADDNTKELQIKS